jgi:hypothetical protein
MITNTIIKSININSMVNVYHSLSNEIFTPENVNRSELQQKYKTIMVIYIFKQYKTKDIDYFFKKHKK